MAREGKVGAMEPDKYADLIVSSKDYFALPEGEIRTLTSALNLVGGSIVYAGPRVRRPGSTLEVIDGGSPVPVGEPPVPASHFSWQGGIV